MRSTLVVLAFCFVAVHAKRLIITDENPEPTWMTDEAVAKLTPGFMDVTAYPEPIVSNTTGKQVPYPAGPTHQIEVLSIFNLIDMSQPETLLIALQSFHNRYYTTFGAESGEFLFDEVLAVVQLSGRADVSARQWIHNWPQRSVIARIEGTLSQELVILGAHQDSVNIRGNDRPNDRAPGADDDGSGTVGVYEMFRAMVASGFQPQRTIEFQFYAAEEVGLLGSQDIANQYAAEGRTVRGMTQYDMIGYATDPSQEVIDVSQSVSVDAALSAFFGTVVTAYTSVPQRPIAGTSSSDHASFDRAGYPACRGRESQVYPFIHTADDLVANVNFGFMRQFVQYGIGLAVELSYL